MSEQMLRDIVAVQLYLKGKIEYWKKLGEQQPDVDVELVIIELEHMLQMVNKGMVKNFDENLGCC